MEQFPKISIVTACYNHEKFIGKTIESVLSQNYPELEYIVIDDGSTDQSWKIIRSFKDQLACCERMEGFRDSVTIALNYGFSKTTGSIMAWLNSDDILLPNSLFTVADIFSSFPSVDWITGMATTINFRTQILNSKLMPKNKFDYLTGDWKVIQQESTFWRKDLWNRTGGRLNGELKLSFDTELWTRFFSAADHYHVNAPIGAFRSGLQSMTVRDPDLFSEQSSHWLHVMSKDLDWYTRIMTILYRVLKSFRRVSGLIPYSAFRWPVLRDFCHLVIEYSFEKGAWIVKRANPFRRYYF